MGDDPTATGPLPRTGLGTATVMREPDPHRRLRLLDVAYSCGIRHFDTAPLYGLGQAERLVGKWWRTHPDVCVATKFGRLPSRAAGVAGRLQRPGRALARQFPAARRLLRAHGGPSAVQPVASPFEVSRSVRRSLSELGVETIPLLLLHELHRDDVDDDVVEALIAEVRSGRVAALGVSGELDVVTSFGSLLGEVFTRAQLPWSREGLRWAGGDPPVPVIWYATAQKLGDEITRIAAQDEELLRALSPVVGSTALDHAAGVRLSAMVARVVDPGGLVLIGSSRPEHIEETAAMMRAADSAGLTLPALLGG